MMDAMNAKPTGLRITWAIAAKDIADALKNKTTLSTIISVLFLIIAYRLLPSLQNADLLPRLAIYDQGQSRWVDELENSTAFDLFLARSRSEMEAFLGHRDTVALGLELLPDFDQRLTSNEPVELDGSVIHWASAGAATDTRTFFEAQLTRLAGKPVRIKTDGNTVYTQKNSRGYALLTSLAIVFAITMIGVSLVPHLMFEEKRTKTLDALLVSPASAAHIVMGKAVSGLFYCLTGTIVALALNVSLVNQWALAVAAAILGSLFAVALGLLLGSMIEDMGKFTLGAWFLLIPLLAPPMLVALRDILPQGLIAVLGWVPTVALSRLLRVSFSNHARLAEFGPEAALIVGWAALLIAAVVWIVRRSDR